MISEQVSEFRKRLKTKLSPMRYEHSLSVSFICIALAMRYGIDIQKAELAGILHDCAKCYRDDELIKKCEKHHIKLTADERKAPAVIHAKYGAWMTEHEYGITDSEILEAIRWHTTGKADMSALDMILYIADYIEPRRDKAVNLDRMRHLAFVNLEQTMYEMLGSSLKYLERKNSHIDSMTREAHNYYSQIMRDKKGDTNAI